MLTKIRGMNQNGTDVVSPVVWNRQMSTGNGLIDGDHKYLISLFNSVDLALSKPSVLPHLPLFFDQLVEYTQEHFRREEEIQIRIEWHLLKLLRVAIFPNILSSNGPGLVE